MSSFKLIALHYLKKSFFFDFIAIIPFDLMFKRTENDKYHIFRLIKLLRIPRLVALINVEKWKSHMKSYY